MPKPLESWFDVQGISIMLSLRFNHQLQPPKACKPPSLVAASPATSTGHTGHSAAPATPGATPWGTDDRRRRHPTWRRQRHPNTARSGGQVGVAGDGVVYRESTGRGHDLRESGSPRPLLPVAGQLLTW